MGLFDKLSGLFSTSERETDEYRSMAANLYNSLKDGCLREDFAQYVARFIKHPCERTSDELVEWWAAQRANVISTNGVQQFIDIVETNLKRSLVPEEKAFLLDSKVLIENPGIIYQCENDRREHFDEFGKRIVSMLEKKILHLPGTMQLHAEQYE